MKRFFLIRWQAIPFATLILFSASVFSELSIDVQASGKVIIVSGISSTAQRVLLHDPSRVYLQLEKNLPAPSMPITLETLSDNRLAITPMFPLVKGGVYQLSIPLAGQKFFQTSVVVDHEKSSQPVLLHVYPNTAIIPENILRIYLQFSEPMARGQIRGKVLLTDAQGRRVNSPFLNLHTELWNKPQTRVTLLLDPGRIKQGVGPNVDAGAPFTSGNSYTPHAPWQSSTYTIVIDPELEDISGNTIAAPFDA